MILINGNITDIKTIPTPKDIECLKENYGLLLNDEDYQVIYYYEGDNLQPRIKVFKKEKNYE